MAITPEYREHLADLFSGIGRIDVRRMFGGAGLYLEDACFAIVLGGEQLMMRGDDLLAQEFENEGGERWVYEHKSRGKVAMPYWSLPDSALDDPEEACHWARRALGPARKAAAGKGRCQGTQSRTQSGQGRLNALGKIFQIKGGETRRVLWLFSSSVPGQVRFRAEPTDGSDPSGTVELARRRWFDWQRETYPLHARNVFDKGMSDSDYRLTVTPENDTQIVFETRHFRAEYLWKILVAVLALGVLSPLLIMLLANSST